MKIENEIELYVFGNKNIKMKFTETNQWRHAKTGEWYITKQPHSTGIRAVKSTVNMIRRKVMIIIPSEAQP